MLMLSPSLQGQQHPGADNSRPLVLSEEGAMREGLHPQAPEVNIPRGSGPPASASSMRKQINTLATIGRCNELRPAMTLGLRFCLVQSEPAKGCRVVPGDSSATR